MSIDSIGFPTVAEGGRFPHFDLRPFLKGVISLILICGRCWSLFQSPIGFETAQIGRISGGIGSSLNSGVPPKTGPPTILTVRVNGRPNAGNHTGAYSHTSALHENHDAVLRRDSVWLLKYCGPSCQLAPAWMLKGHIWHKVPVASRSAAGRCRGKSDDIRETSEATLHPPRCAKSQDPDDGWVSTQ